MDTGGLGDMIGRIPAIEHMLKHNPHVSAVLWSPNYFIGLAEQFFRGNGRVRVRPIEKFTSTGDLGLPHYSFKQVQHTTFATNLTRHAFNVLNDFEVPQSALEYPNLFKPDLMLLDMNPIDSKYVCLTLNYTSPTRRMLGTEANKLIDYFLKQGLGVTLLGSTTAEVKAKRHITAETLEVDTSKPGVKDMRDKTTLLAAARLMRGARCVIGMDGGLLHLAACTHVPIVMGFTSVAPRHRQIIRRGQLGWRLATVQPDESLTCRFCQSEMGKFLYGHGFRDCLYGDFKCIDQMTYLKFAFAYEELMEGLAP